MLRIIFVFIFLLINTFAWSQTEDESDFNTISAVKEILEKGQYEKALSSLDSILFLNSNNIYALELKGSIYANFKNDFLKAIKYYKKAEQIYPENAMNLANIGRNYHKLDSVSKGNKYLERAYNIDPNDEYISLQYAYFVVEDLDEKINVYEETILTAKLKLASNQFVHEESLRDIHNNIGYNLYLKKEFTKSALFLLEGLQYGLENVDHLNNLGNSLQRLNYLQAAIIYYDFALKRDPKKSFSLNGKANTYLRMRKIDSSCVYWKKTLDSGYKFNPEWKEIWDIEDPALLISRFCE